MWDGFPLAGPGIVFLVLLIWRIRKHREESHREDSPS